MTEENITTARPESLNRPFGADDIVRYTTQMRDTAEKLGIKITDKHTKWLVNLLTHRDSAQDVMSNLAADTSQILMTTALMREILTTYTIDDAIRKHSRILPNIEENDTLEDKLTKVLGFALRSTDIARPGDFTEFSKTSLRQIVKAFLAEKAESDRFSQAEADQLAAALFLGTKSQHNNYIPPCVPFISTRIDADAKALFNVQNKDYIELLTTFEKKISAEIKNAEQNTDTTTANAYTRYMEAFQAFRAKIADFPDPKDYGLSIKDEGNLAQEAMSIHPATSKIASQKKNVINYLKSFHHTDFNLEKTTELFNSLGFEDNGSKGPFRAILKMLMDKKSDPKKVRDIGRVVIHADIPEIYTESIHALENVRDAYGDKVIKLHPENNPVIKIYGNSKESTSLPASSGWMASQMLFCVKTQGGDDILCEVQIAPTPLQNVQKIVHKIYEPLRQVKEKNKTIAGMKVSVPDFESVSPELYKDMVDTYNYIVNQFKAASAPDAKGLFAELYKKGGDNFTKILADEFAEYTVTRFSDRKAKSPTDLLAKKAHEQALDNKDHIIKMDKETIGVVKDLYDKLNNMHQMVCCLAVKDTPWQAHYVAAAQMKGLKQTSVLTYLEEILDKEKVEEGKQFILAHNKKYEKPTQKSMSRAA